MPTAFGRSGCRSSSSHRAQAGAGVTRCRLPHGNSCRHRHRAGAAGFACKQPCSLVNCTGDLIVHNGQSAPAMEAEMLCQSAAVSKAVRPQAKRAQGWERTPMACHVHHAMFIQWSILLRLQADRVLFCVGLACLHKGAFHMLKTLTRKICGKRPFSQTLIRHDTSCMLFMHSSL